MPVESTYVLRQGPEPLSRQALQLMRRPAMGGTDQPLQPVEAQQAQLEQQGEQAPDGRLRFPHMQSESFKRIHYEMLRYCHGEIDGLSVLIAGQRGAGKTTLTKLIIQEVMQDSEGLIPLPLLLHGPTIIDPDAVTADASDVDTSGERAPLEKQRALRQIVTALYRSLSTAIYDAWLIAAEEAKEARRAQVELLSLRAHLDLQLERAPPDPDLLRKIWSRAGFLNSGVAFYLLPARRREANRRESVSPIPPIAGDRDDQGLREIVALSACADAYRVILGKFDEVLQREQKREQLQELAAAPIAVAEAKKSTEDSKSKSATEKLGPPALGSIVGLATAILSTFSDKTSDKTIKTGIVALLVGALVWAASWAAMTYGVRRSRQETRREAKLVVRWDIDRLERDLPVLLKRVKDAGFAPIFVLDELDKAKDAASALERFLKLAKHIVTDHAAFLFLTNRDYYEQLVASEYVDMGHAP
jgi:hypothetical protein